MNPVRYPEVSSIEPFCESVSEKPRLPITIKHRSLITRLLDKYQAERFRTLKPRTIQQIFFCDDSNQNEASYSHPYLPPLRVQTKIWNSIYERPEVPESWKKSNTGIYCSSSNSRNVLNSQNTLNSWTMLFRVFRG